MTPEQKTEWDQIDVYLDDLQALCQKHKIAIIHNKEHIGIYHESDPNKLVVKFLYITPGHMGYSR